MSTNEVRQFYEIVAHEFHARSDGKGRPRLEYRDLPCGACGRVTRQRVEYGTGLETRRCIECGVKREYRVG